MPNMMRDLDPSSLIRTRAGYLPMKVLMPPGAVGSAGGQTAIAPQIVMGPLLVRQQVPTHPAGTGLIVASSVGTGGVVTGAVLAIPCCPVFYSSAATAQYLVEITGIDHFCDNVPTYVYQVNAGNVDNRQGKRAWSKINSIFITPTNAAAVGATLNVGWDLITTGAGRLIFPLPYKPRRVPVPPSAVTQASNDTPKFIMPTNLGGGTAAGTPVGVLKAILLAQTDIEAATLGIVSGFTVEPPAPVEFLVFVDPESVAGAF